MAYSMTGYGRFEAQNASLTLSVEMKSVNHRYLDVSLKLPRKFSFFENEARNIIKQRIRRGKIDVFVNYEENADSVTEVTYHPGIAQAYYDGLQQMKEQFSLTDNITLGLLGRFPNVFTEEAREDDQEELAAFLTDAFMGAIDDFLSHRRAEGERLIADLLEKINVMEGLVDQIAARSPAIIEEYKQRLLQKTRELLENNAVEESRIYAEVVLYTDKICVDEEIVRLKSHIQEARDTLQREEDVGKKMDFLAQEMNRESNTILSKSTDVEIADIGIELKTLIEKIREQIQNLE